MHSSKLLKYDAAMKYWTVGLEKQLICEKETLESKDKLKGNYILRGVIVLFDNSVTSPWLLREATITPGD